MKILNKIKSKINYFYIITASVVMGVFIKVLPVQAADFVEGALNTTITWLIQASAWLVYIFVVIPNGWASGVLMKILIQVAGMGGGVISLPAVIQGWEVVLNLTNMFFVVMLLVIAFATVLKIESYSYKKLLPTLIIVAILVNFSRIICGLAIDASQVVMKTFVDAMRGSAEGNIAIMFQMNKLMTLQVQPEELKGQDQNIQYLLAMIMAGVMLGVLMVVILVYTVVIISRIIIFWIATILSPIAFACAVLPATKKYFQQWLELFSRYLIVGPMAMFFLWLALFITASATDSSIVGEIGSSVEGDFAEKMTEKNDAVTEALNPEVLANFIIATLLLLKGMELAQQMSSEFSKATGKAADLGKWLATSGPTRWVGKQAYRVSKPVAQHAASKASDWIYEKSGVDLNVKRVWETMKSESGDIKKERELIGRAKAKKFAESGDIRGWLGASDYMYRQYTPFLGEQQNKMFGQGVARWGRTHGKFKDQMNKYQNSREEYFQFQGGMDERMQEFEKGNITYEKEAEISNQLEQMQRVESGIDADISNPKDQSTRDLLGSFMGELESNEDFEGANSIRNVLNGSGTLGAREGDFRRFLDKQKGELEEKINPEKVNPMSQEEYNNALAAFTATEQRQLKDAEATMNQAKADMGELAPVVDYGAIQAQRGYMEEEIKKINTDNEDDLKSLLNSKMKAGDASGTLAVILQSAKVGHMNEMMDQMGLDQSPEGMRILFEALIGKKDAQSKAFRDKLSDKEKGLYDNIDGMGLNIDRQLAMSVADDSSRAAKAINHWAYSEMVTSEQGQFNWRPPQEQSMRQYNEMTKANIPRILREGNRLALGQHYKDKDGDNQWRFSAAGLQAVGESLGKGMTDSMRKNLINTNWVKQMLGTQGLKGEGQDQVKALEAVMKEEISKRPNEAAEIRESFKKLLSYTSAAGDTGFDPDAVVIRSARKVGGFH